MNSYSELLPIPTGGLEIADSPSVTMGITETPLKFSLIIPSYNEGGNIQEIVKILSGLLDSQIPGEYELIVVDDDSPDRTWKIAQELTPQYPQLKVMRRQKEKGLSTAVIRGWQVARGEVLGVIDADLQHPPEVLLKLWQEIEKGADLAVGSRHVEGGGVSEWSIIRRFLSRGAQMLGLIILPEVIGRLSDPMSGYFMVRRDAIIGKSLSPVGYKILIEVTGRGNIRWIGEVGYVFRERQTGESKVTWKQYIEYIQHLLRLRFSLWPIKRFIRFGIVGFSGVFVDLGIFYVLRTLLGLGLTRSAILSSEVAIINNFLWNDLWTFGDISSQQKGWRKRIKRLLKFNVVCLSGLILNVLLVNLLFNVLGMNEYLAKLMAIAAVTFWNFWFNLKLSWRVTDAGK
ncbi:MAG: glycosyltransferase [Xenococcaceae cyanobacterium MO_188.B32]|nr:glycosyltransferase [Xenococcaceae cyanobacterium MO_188.B32]